jgi:hypothetical protein
MDISSNAKYPAKALSNFSCDVFILDGVTCNSREGWLQSLKFKSPEMQEEVCKLVGVGAKKRGSQKKWFKTQTLYWRGEEYKRDSIEYQDLLDRAYNACYEQSEPFRKALAQTVGATLTHAMGKNKKSETVLTTQEFCSRLTILRDYGRIER